MKEFVTSDGSRLAYDDRGEGGPLLFLHGWLMSRRVWTYQDPLAAGFRLIAPDLRGHGNSDSCAFSYAGCVADLAGLMDHLGIGKTIIVGWSMGAQIALKAWSLLRDRVAALVLVDGTPRFCAHEDYGQGVPLAEARGMALRLRRSFVRTADEFCRGMFSEQDLGEIDLSSLAATIVPRLPQLPIALAALDELISTDMRLMLPGVTVPVLLLHGESDRICLPGASSYMHAHLPDSHLRLLPGVGHAPFLVRPAEFNGQVSTFCRRVYGVD